MSRKIAAITLDIESDLQDPQSCVRMFEDGNLRDRYISVIRENDVKVTGFLVTSLLDRYGSAIKQLSQLIPIEFALHSHNHDLRYAGTREDMTRSYQAYQAFWRTTPLGYRAPIGLVDNAKLQTLLDFELEYDSSIFPSIRFDRYSYTNLSFPNAPFEFVRGQDSILELPLACLRAIRLVFSLSYCKLLGWGTYRVLVKLFSLPEIVVFNAHPYDFYTPLIADNLVGWRRFAHLRNGHGAFEIFDQIIKMLKHQGYEFLYMSELSRYVRGLPDIRQISVNQLR